MRTANNTNNYTVEGLVAKYRNFVKENTPKYTEYVPGWEEQEGFYAEVPESDVDASPDQQLIATLYHTIAGVGADKEILSVLSDYTEHFYKNVLNDKEFAFLCEHFSEVIEYEFSHRAEWNACTQMPLTDYYEKLNYLIKERVSFKKNQTVFIPDAGFCDIAMHFKGCVVKGYTSIMARRFKDMDIVWALGQIRLYAAGIKSEIVPFIDLNEEITVSHLQDTDVDLVVCLSSLHRYDTLYNLLKKGGQMYLFAQRDDLVDYARYKEFRYKKMGEEFDEHEEKRALTRKEFLNKLIKSRAIHSLVSYYDKNTILDVPVDFVLLYIEKKPHSKVVVESINRDVVSEVNPSVLDADLLWPGYYMVNRPKDGKPLSALVKMFNTEDEVVEQYWAREDKGIKLSGDLRVLTPRNFGDKYADTCMDEKDLTKLSDPMFEGWEPHMLSIHHPGVCVLGNTEKWLVGYVKDDPTNKFVCIDIVPYLLPKRNIDVRYIAALLLFPEVKEQILTICDGSITAKTMSLILDRIIVPKHTPKERIQFLADANYEALMSTQQEMKKNHEDYKKAVRMRKHALTQSLSSIKSQFRSLNAFRLRNGGKMADDDQISRITKRTVSEAFEYLSSKIEDMMPVMEHIADVEYSFDTPEWIDPEQFIQDFIEKNGRGWLNFTPVITWEKGHNRYKSTIIDPLTKEVAVKKDDVMYSLWFPKDALVRVLNNIISNAKGHAFIDESRKDYQLRFSWHTEGITIKLEIENNGTPIPADRDTASLLEYGVSSALHQDGHNGIGCNEINDIMQRYDGNIEIVSTPQNEFTVKYVLSFKSNILYSL